MFFRNSNDRRTVFGLILTFWTGLLLTVNDVLTTCSYLESQRKLYHFSQDGIKLWFMTIKSWQIPSNIINQLMWYNLLWLWRWLLHRLSTAPFCQQQPYSGLHSTGKSYPTFLWNDPWVQTFHHIFFIWDVQVLCNWKCKSLFHNFTK